MVKKKGQRIFATEIGEKKVLRSAKMSAAQQVERLGNESESCDASVRYRTPPQSMRMREE
jgi:hypothetical protein